MHPHPQTPRFGSFESPSPSFEQLNIIELPWPLDPSDWLGLSYTFAYRRPQAIALRSHPQRISPRLVTSCAFVCLSKKYSKELNIVEVQLYKVEIVDIAQCKLVYGNLSQWTQSSVSAHVACVESTIGITPLAVDNKIRMANHVNNTNNQIIRSCLSYEVPSEVSPGVSGRFPSRKEDHTKVRKKRARGEGGSGDNPLVKGDFHPIEASLKESEDVHLFLSKV
jgi:hypothetical protein